MKTNPLMDQYFLKDPAKIQIMTNALQIHENDRLAELGAGTGSISVHLPEGNPLYLLEADPLLCKLLRQRFAYRPHTEILAGDALAGLLKIQVNKLLINLPWNLTDQVLDILADYPFERAVMAIRKGQPLPRYPGVLDIQPLCTLEGACFDPVQPYDSECIQIVRLI
jgi:16S rRNA A1518/A1519 N6-dimethyltransferase RsmA/KsgA/DIM1 with predicted DNA glycosylase/AP lyase activity